MEYSALPQFFSPIFSTSLFLFSYLLHLAQPLFFFYYFLPSSFLNCLILLSFLHCVASSYSLLFVFDLIFFSSILVIASCFHLSSPLFSLSRLLSLSTLSFFYSPLLILITSPYVSFYCLQYSQFLLTSLLISSCLISLSFSALHLLFVSTPSLFLFSSSLFSPHSLI